MLPRVNISMLCVMVMIFLLGSCSRLSESKLNGFDKNDFDEKVNSITTNKLYDKRAARLSDSVAVLERIIREQIEFLDKQDSPWIPFSSGKDVREHYSKSRLFPARVTKNLNFIDSVLQQRYEEYFWQNYGFSPKMSFLTSGIPFQKEFFEETMLNTDEHQKFLCSLFIAVRRAENDFYNFLKTKPANEP